MVKKSEYFTDAKLESLTIKKLRDIKNTTLNYLHALMVKKSEYFTDAKLESLTIKKLRGIKNNL